MKSYLTKTPGPVKKLWSGFVWSIPTSEKKIYLSFDDGPHPEITPWVLKTLKKVGAKATFFCVGDNIRKYPDTFARIIKEGHTIGNHTYHHLNAWKTKTETYLKDVSDTESIIRKYLKKENNLFRPPYGRIRPKQAKLLRDQAYRIVMWDVLSGDFDQDISPEKCLKNVMQNTQNGSIIVFHDSEKAFSNLSYSLPKILELFTAKGYRFEAITPELIQNDAAKKLPY